MTHTSRSAPLRSVLKDRSESKNGGSAHNWGSLENERDLEFMGIDTGQQEINGLSDDEESGLSDECASFSLCLSPPIHPCDLPHPSLAPPPARPPSLSCAKLTSPPPATSPKSKPAGSPVLKAEKRRDLSCARRNLSCAGLKFGQVSSSGGLKFGRGLKVERGTEVLKAPMGGHTAAPRVTQDLSCGRT
ncbi:hypothetical protein C8R44DRAFT_954928 [Mycena epipterygia]|nr:hypothetical protein C8R44DRAFT_954928 [Mycena epipterygia]